MSDNTTIRMLEAYIETAEPTMFLSGQFQTPARNFHTSEDIEFDIQRSGENVSVVVQDLSTDYRLNSNDISTNKRFKPPIYKEKAPLNVFDLINREDGQNPFEAPNFQANALVRTFRVMKKLESKIRRSIEQQASQVLQTGAMDLKDAAGTTLYSVDFKPKATHFPTAGVPWATIATATPLADLESLANEIRVDAKMRPDRVYMGSAAYNNFAANPEVQALLNNRRINIGEIEPVMVGDGAVFKGSIWAGSYEFSIWTYPQFFTDAAGATTPYIDPDNVIMTSSGGRLDLTFGAIPRIIRPDARVLQFLPARISNDGGGLDMFPNVWVTVDSEQLFVGVGSRPMAIPTAIDSYGRLYTGV